MFQLAVELNKEWHLTIEGERLTGNFPFSSGEMEQTFPVQQLVPIWQKELSCKFVFANCETSISATNHKFVLDLFALRTDRRVDEPHSDNPGALWSRRRASLRRVENESNLSRPRLRYWSVHAPEANKMSLFWDMQHSRLTRWEIFPFQKLQKKLTELCW